jgi:hypothetical protein
MSLDTPEIQTVDDGFSVRVEYLQCVIFPGIRDSQPYMQPGEAPKLGYVMGLVDFCEVEPSFYFYPRFYINRPFMFTFVPGYMRALSRPRMISHTTCI